MRARSDLGRALCVLLFVACALLVACAKQESTPRPLVLPTVPAPLVAERNDPPKPLPPSRLLVPLETDVSAYEAALGEVLRENLVLRQDQWTLVTPPDDKLEVETL